VIGVTVAVEQTLADAALLARQFAEVFKLPFHIFVVNSATDVCQAKLELHRHFLIKQTVVYLDPQIKVSDRVDFTQFEDLKWFVAREDLSVESWAEIAAYRLSEEYYFDSSFFVFNARHFRVLEDAAKLYRKSDRAIGSNDTSERPLLNYVAQKRLPAFDYLGRSPKKLMLLPCDFLTEGQ